MNQILALWVHARSLSTAMETFFLERKDFKVLHEPFAFLFYIHEKRHPIPHYHENPDHPLTYDDTKNWILSEAEKSPVAFKDMCLHCYDYLSKDEEFLKKMNNTFLIREPNKTIISHWKINPDVTCEEIGYEYLFKIFRQVADMNNNNPPPVIDADDLENDPVGILKAYCKAAGIKYIPEALQWEEGDREEWEDWKEWHIDAAISKGIQKNMEKFDISVDDKPHLKSYYEYHLPFYEAMYKYRLKPIK